MPSSWNPTFISSQSPAAANRALIILNQPFSKALLDRVWNACSWRACADGGANRLHDVLPTSDRERKLYMPDIVKGDLDSIRQEVKEFYEQQGVKVVKDDDQYSTDLIKCMEEISDQEVVILGGLSGRLDQTVHTLSYLHKLRQNGKSIFAVTDDNIAWVLDSGEHHITVNHSFFGPTCGLLPVGVASTLLTTKGLKWNLTNHESSFDGLMSTSNHLLPEEPVVQIRTSAPIWWTMELRALC